MVTQQECLGFATECEEMAADPAQAHDREQFLKLAELWREMAANFAMAAL